MCWLDQVSNALPAEPAKAKFTTQGFPAVPVSTAALIAPESSCAPVNWAGSVGSIGVLGRGTALAPGALCVP